MTNESPERANVCPFHGPIPDNEGSFDPVVVYCSGCDTLYSKGVLSSAYCWKRIDELEAQLKTETIRTDNSQVIATLEARIKELEAQLGT